jgi:hypothetical protein
MKGSGTMINSLKKIKLIAGVSFLVESVTFAVLALILFGKKVCGIWAQKIPA